MNDLISMTGELVRLLPSRDGMKQKQTTANYTWTPPRDFREICACQGHARRERTLWRRALRVAKRRAVALLVTVPLAFGAIGIDAMNISLPALALPAFAEDAITQHRLPVFTTRKVSETFLHPEQAPTKLTLGLAKEEFFKNEVPFGSIIYREALKNDLAPELIAAIVESESDFRADLVSNKNAQGLMQILPETCRLMGCTDPFNPHTNVAAGTKYFRYLLNRFGGDERLALAAYNAGEGTVERVGGVPEYRETIDYLDRVATRTVSYRKRVQDRYKASVQLQASVLAQ
jgi:soluble lytic murein transglycosylase-like protein